MVNTDPARHGFSSDGSTSHHSGGELGTSYFLPRLVGRGRAAAALLTGKEISTEQAEQWGLLNEVRMFSLEMQRDEKTWLYLDYLALD